MEIVGDITVVLIVSGFVIFVFRVIRARLGPPTPSAANLERDYRLLGYGLITGAASWVTLGLLKLVRVLLGLDEQEFYDTYPASWWFVVSVGFIFIGGAIYTIKKTIDVQLEEHNNHEDGGKKEGS